MRKLLRFKDLKEKQVVDNRPQLGRMIKRYNFPKPIRLGENTVAWFEDEIENWLESRREQGGKTNA